MSSQRPLSLVLNRPLGIALVAVVHRLPHPPVPAQQPQRYAAVGLPAQRRVQEEAREPGSTRGAKALGRVMRGEAEVGGVLGDQDDLGTGSGDPAQCGVAVCVEWRGR